MNSILLLYTTIIIIFSYLTKYRWAVLFSVLGAIHVCWFAKGIMFFLIPLGCIILFLLIVYLFSLQHYFTNQNMTKAIASCELQEKQLRQLKQQEKKLEVSNQKSQRGLEETVVIYDYVKKLGSILDFKDAVCLFKETVLKLTQFASSKLILIEKNNPIAVYNVLPGNKEPERCSLETISELEEEIVVKLIKDSEIILDEGKKSFPLKYYPEGGKTYLAVPLLAGKELVAVFVLVDVTAGGIEKIQFVAGQLALEIKKTQLYSKVKELSIIDSLTNLNLRRQFMKLLLNERDRCYRQDQSLGFLMIDVDWFKKHNDEHGHLVGDLILKVIGTILLQNSRENDLVCRYGGDEFALALPRAGLEEAQVVAQRLRQAINEYKFQVAQGKLQVSVSIGLAICPAEKLGQPQAIQRLIDSTDRALYQAKAQARNCIVVYSGE